MINDAGNIVAEDQKNGEINKMILPVGQERCQAEYVPSSTWPLEILAQVRDEY